MKKIFKTQLNAAVIVLIPACIGINYLGKLFASFLRLFLCGAEQGVRGRYNCEVSA